MQLRVVRGRWQWQWIDIVRRALILSLCILPASTLERLSALLGVPPANFYDGSDGQKDYVGMVHQPQISIDVSAARLQLTNTKSDTTSYCNGLVEA